MSLVRVSCLGFAFVGVRSLHVSQVSFHRWLHLKIAVTVQGDRILGFKACIGKSK